MHTFYTIKQQMHIIFNHYEILNHCNIVNIQPPKHYISTMHSKDVTLTNSKSYNLGPYTIGYLTQVMCVQKSIHQSLHREMECAFF